MNRNRVWFFGKGLALLMLGLLLVTGCASTGSGHSAGRGSCPSCNR